jgi:putative SOS response-associated peptidase YedK
LFDLFDTAPQESDVDSAVTGTVAATARAAGEDAAGAVHDRVPAFPTPAAWDTWLAPEKLEKDQVGDVLDLLAVDSWAVASTLRTRPVSRAVNNVRALDRRDAGLIEAVTRGGGDR